jgi:hypothetical protein
LRIHSHDGPRIGSAGLPLRIPSGRRHDIWNRIPTPAQRPGTRIKSAHDPSGHGDALVIVNRRSHDDQIVNNRGRRSHVIPPGTITRHIPQTYLAIVAEVHARLARARVERNKPRIQRSFVETTAAGLASSPGSIEPGGDAAIYQSIAIIERQINCRIINPPLFAGLWVKRNHPIEAGSEIEHPVDQNRCSFKSASPPIVAAV